MLAAQVGCFHACLMLLQDADDLPSGAGSSLSLRNSAAKRDEFSGGCVGRTHISVLPVKIDQ
jgi:hypothetical protein